MGKIRNDLKSRIRIRTTSFRIHNTALCTTVVWTGYVAHDHDLYRVLLLLAGARNAGESHQNYREHAWVGGQGRLRRHRQRLRPAQGQNEGNQCWGSVTFWCGSVPLTNGSGGTLFLVLKILYFAKILQKFYFASIISVCSTPLWQKERFRIRSSD